MTCHEHDIHKAQVQQPTELMAVTLIGTTVIKLEFALAVLLDGEFTSTHNVVAVQVLSGEENHFRAADGAHLSTLTEVGIETRTARWPHSGRVVPRTTISVARKCPDN